MFRFSLCQRHPLVEWGDSIARTLGTASLQFAAGQGHVAEMNVLEATRQLRGFVFACSQPETGWSDARHQNPLH